MKTYELKDLEIQNIWSYFIKYAQILYIQKNHHKDLEIKVKNGITSLCKVHKSETGFTPKQFNQITGKKTGECPPFVAIDGIVHSSINYGIWNMGNQIELVKELTECNSTVQILNCDNWNDGYNKTGYNEIKKATAALEKMNPSQIFKIV